LFETSVVIKLNSIVTTSRASYSAARSSALRVSSKSLELR
jgi:hypothetical protein